MPDGLTLRELAYMQEGRSKAEWDRVATLITHLRLCHGDKEAKVEAFHPHYAKHHHHAKFQKHAAREKDKQK